MLCKSYPKTHSFIIKGVHYSLDADTIQQEVTETIKDAKTFRITSAATGKPTTYIRVITTSEQDFHYAIENGISILYIHHKCEPSHPRVRTTQCMRCHQFGHSSSNCFNQSLCLKCGQADHKIGQCPEQSPICHNCKGNHLPTTMQCPIKRQQVASTSENKTYKEALMTNKISKKTTDSDTDSDNYKHFHKTMKTRLPQRSSKHHTITVNINQLIESLIKILWKTFEDLNINYYGINSIHSNIKQTLAQVNQ